MPHPNRRRAAGVAHIFCALLAGSSLLAAGCASAGPEPVPEPEHWGSPQVVEGDDGRLHTVHRFRVVDWMAPVLLVHSARQVPPRGGESRAELEPLDAVDIPMGK